MYINSQQLALKDRFIEICSQISDQCHASSEEFQRVTPLVSSDQVSSRSGLSVTHTPGVCCQ